MVEALSVFLVLKTDSVLIFEIFLSWKSSLRCASNNLHVIMIEKSLSIQGAFMTEGNALISG